jgi:hypothetical protein
LVLLRGVLKYPATYQPLRRAAAIALGRLLTSDKLVEAGKRMPEDFGAQGDYLFEVTARDGEVWCYLDKALDMLLLYLARPTYTPLVIDAVLAQTEGEGIRA